MKNEYIPLCFRCEHRALFHESNGNYHPRCECGDKDSALVSCYMFKPISPLILRKTYKDPRPISLNLFGSRVCAKTKDQKYAKLQLKGTVYDNKVTNKKGTCMLIKWD